MSTPEIIFLCAVFTIPLCATSYLVGNERGIKQGRDLQWVDDFLQKIESDKARRNKLGQFKPKRTP